MCGIFGCFLNRELSLNDVKLAEKCLKDLKHRGPDGEGIWFDKKKGILLGHTRLAIIDLSENNAQPMTRAEHILVYNGELYNYRQLKKQLRAMGEDFTTSGDTEVFLKSFIRWRNEALDKFDGMFAYALYNGEKLQLGTDPFGEKPLYILRNDDGIYFSSESNVFERHFDVQRSIDKATIEQFLGLGFLPEPKTGFKNVEKVGPATTIVIEPNNLTKTRYWIPYKENSSTKVLRPSDIDDIHHELINSVKNRMISDVPIGIFLSSGIDSSVVAAIIKKELKIDMHAFTVKFTGGEVYDESTNARKIADYLGIEHIILQGNNNSFVPTVSDVFSMFGELNDNLTILSYYIMAKEASKYVKVVLTGIGGDEMFYGFNKYMELYKFRHIFALPKHVGNICKILAAGLFPRKKRLSLYFGANKENSYLSVKNRMAFEYLEKMVGLKKFLAAEFDHFSKTSFVAARMFDICNALPYSYIINNERGSMRASVETRTPYLNRRLFSRIQQHRSFDYFRNGRKWVLRCIAERYIPPKLLDRNKRGFIPPTDEFLKSFISRKDLFHLATQYNVGHELIDAADSDSKAIRLRLALLKEFLSLEQR